MGTGFKLVYLYGSKGEAPGVRDANSHFTFICICVTPLGWVLGGEEEDQQETDEDTWRERQTERGKTRAHELRDREEVRMKQNVFVT